MSYAPAHVRRRAPWIAFLLIPLLAVAGVLVPTQAASAAPGDVAGATLSWGFKESFRTYVAGPIAHGSVSGDGVATASAPYSWSGGTGQSTGGTGSVAYPGSVKFQGHLGMNVPADEYALDVTISDVRITLSSATAGTLTADVVSRSLETGEFATYSDVALAALDLSTASDTSTAEVVGFSGVSATLTAAGAPAFAGFYEAGTALDALSFSWPVEQAPAPEPAPVPTLQVSETSGLDPEGATITITGTDYTTGYANRHGTGKAGVYLQIGWIDDTWRPSEGADSSTRNNAYQRWVKENPTSGLYLQWTENGDTADFSWTVEIDQATLDAKTRDGATLAVFTTGAGGTTQPENELAVPITFATPTTPSLEVSQTTGLDPEGATITITGTDYTTGYANRHGTGKAGVYLQIGWIDDTWRPSEGADSSTRNNAYQRWVKENPTSGLYLQWTENGDTADFSWTVEIDQATLDAKTRDGATLAVFTTGAGGTTQPENELAVPITFATPAPNPGGGSGGTPTAPALTKGSLSWGVKASFRSYVTSPIAHGSITTTGVTASGSGFVFPQAGNAQLSGGTGTVSYSGSLRFTGHEGVLDLRLSDPQVRIDSATRGTLLLRVNGSRVAFASLALGSGSSSTDATGAVRYTGVPATLTTAGASAFTYLGSGFYPAGTALDPVSFVVGSANSSTAGTVVVASATRAAGSTNTPDATPPASDGILVTDGELVEGGEITATADGFQPNEDGILAVMYSEPTVLSEELVADSAGRVTWTGALPRGLTGTHTLTFQGSVDRGVVLDIAAATELQCEVTDASLVWGFKETFRAYIDGSIANGEWTTEGNASYATPNFTWSDGAGGADEEGALDVAFSGAVRFVGHGGVLDTTVENPRVLIDGDRAVLLLDVNGTTQSGDPVNEVGVEFAELDLTTATRTHEGDTLTIADIPAVLTADGSAAFGTYPAGESLDPLTLTASVATDCASEAETPSAAPSGDVLEPEQTAGTGWPVWATVLLIALLAAAIIAAVVVLVRRRRA